jgi:hypothetical protein
MYHNAWTEKWSEYTLGPDYSKKKLNGQDLRNKDLRRGKFYGASLRWADLRGAKIYAAIFRHADLSYADLRGLPIDDCELFGAILTGALMSSEQCSYINNSLYTRVCAEYPLTSVDPRWQRDSDHLNCQCCTRRFTFFLRRHHCRSCGRVICIKCSPYQGAYRDLRYQGVKLIQRPTCVHCLKCPPPPPPQKYGPVPVLFDEEEKF